MIETEINWPKQINKILLILYGKSFSPSTSYLNIINTAKSINIATQIKNIDFLINSFFFIFIPFT